MAHQWYVSVDDREEGPYSQEDMEDMARSRRLLPDDYVWHKGMPRWQPADDVLPELFRQRRRAEPAPVYDDVPEGESQAPDKPVPQFPGRLISPAFLVFALLAGCLPWVDVHCNGITILSQSGVQSCFGSYTRHEQTLHNVRQDRPEMARRLENATIDPAPLVTATFGLFLLGVIGGLALRVGGLRATALGVCAGVGILLLAVQVAIGFPIAHEVAVANEEEQQKQLERDQQRFQKQQQQRPNQNPPFGQQPIPPPFNNDHIVLGTSLSVFFWFTPLFAILSFGGLAIEHFSVFAKKQRRRAYY